jgi:hypothetical protein
MHQEDGVAAHPVLRSIAFTYNPPVIASVAMAILPESRHFLRSR